jgi:hypothetical protein
MASDRLSALPDNLLSSDVLSKLSLRDATRCSVLSSRWRYLCTLLTHLKFTSECFAEGETTKRAINSVLFFHSAQLESFELSVSMGDIDRENIGKCFQKWVQCASSKRVKQIALSNILTGSFLDVPTSLFSCECLTLLKLEWFFFIRLPPYFSGFRHLVTCSLSFIYTNDDILDRFVSKCPLLENLTVQHCTGLRNVKIFAVTNSLKKVSLHGFCRQVASLAVLESFVSLEELSIESKWFKVSNCLAFSIYVKVIKHHNFIYREIYHTKFGLQNHATSMEASSLTLSLKSLKKVH